VNKASILILSILIALPSFSVNAQLYKWIDANGEFHVSDRPPLDPEKVKSKNKKPAKIKKIVKKKPKKEVIAWRCKELEEQYENAVNKAMRYSTDKSLAATMRSDAESYKNALEQICN
jgi:hypothetical protein